MTKSLIRTDFTLLGQTGFYEGKVRDVYTIDDDFLIMVVTDRISAFDVVLPRGIPYKGQVLNMIASDFLDATEDIVPNWKIATPDPMVTVGRKADPFKVEMVIRGYLTGHVWREYKAGKREICGEPLPDGMKENQKFEKPIITPTTKAVVRHDEDISGEEIIRQGLVSEKDYEQLKDYTYKLYQRGKEMAADKGLILVDTKYEFGKVDGRICLLDEVHTPDSSRYFYQEGYRERFENGEPQRQLSKEFVRNWLMEQGFRGEEGQSIPELTDDFIQGVSERYIELYEKVTGKTFVKSDISVDIHQRVENNIREYLKR